MALEYSYDPQAGVLRIVGLGTVSLHDRVVFVSRLLADPDLPATAAILIDVNGVTNAPTVDDIRAIRTLVDRLQARFLGRVAITNVTVGHVAISHMIAFSISDESGRVRAFTSGADAGEWLRA